MRKCEANIRYEANIHYKMYLFCIRSNMCKQIFANILKRIRIKWRINGACEYNETYEYVANKTHFHLDSLRGE
jgi:hypothetical protein